MAKGDNDEAPNIIIKKIKKIEGGHHGGAWKVAYADFVTAMMAFFLMLWLLSSTTKEQKEGIAQYFTVTQVNNSGGGDGLLSGKSVNDENSVSDGSPTISLSMAPPAQKTDSTEDGAPLAAELNDAEGAAQLGVGETDAGAGGAREVLSSLAAQRTTAAPTEEALNKGIDDRQKRTFEKAEKDLKQAIKDIPELSQLAGQLIIDHTPEGMRIQLVDEADRPMFKEGSTEPFARTRAMFKEIARIINKLPNRIAITGHTDAAAFQRGDGYGNWELSSDRAILSRRMLQQAGVPDSRFLQISGKAGTEPLFPDDPYLSGNRRISITLMREEPVLAPKALRID